MIIHWKEANLQIVLGYKNNLFFCPLSDSSCRCSFSCNFRSALINPIESYLLLFSESSSETLSTATWSQPFSPCDWSSYFVIFPVGKQQRIWNEFATNLKGKWIELTCRAFESTLSNWNQSIRSIHVIKNSSLDNLKSTLNSNGVSSMGQSFMRTVHRDCEE